MTDSGIRAIFLAERPKLLRLLVARLGRMDEAEDVLQELWIKLQATTPGPIASPVAYLMRMANNLAVDRRRSEVWRQVREQDWMGTRPGAAEQPDAMAAMIARERLTQVEAAIAALPNRVAAVFRRYRLDGVAQKTIAAEMGLSLSLVEKLLQQAYRQIHDTRGSLDAGLPSSQRLRSKEERT